MKKFLSLILSVITLLCLGLFAACDGLGGSSKTDEEIAAELLAEVKGYTYTVGEDRQCKNEENGYEYMWSIDRWLMNEGDFLTINADGTCTVRCFTGSAREYTGTFTIGKFVRVEPNGKTKRCYFELLDNTTPFNYIYFATSKFVYLGQD